VYKKIKTKRYQPQKRKREKNNTRDERKEIENAFHLEQNLKKTKRQVPSKWHNQDGAFIYRE